MHITPEIAYLLGVYFSDGCVSKHGNSYRYCFGCIDEDFAKNVARCLGSVTGKIPKVYHQVRPGRKPMYNVFRNCTEFCLWIKKVTCDKSKIPDFIFTALPYVKHKFITGFVDGDGYISKSKNSKWGTYRFQVGICSSNKEFLESFVSLLRGLGVNVWPKPMVRYGNLGKSSKPVIHYRMNVASFFRNGCRFSVTRKADRQYECIKLLPQRLHATRLRRKSGYENQIDNIRKKS